MRTGILMFALAACAASTVGCGEAGGAHEPYAAVEEGDGLAPAPAEGVAAAPAGDAKGEAVRIPESELLPSIYIGAAPAASALGEKLSRYQVKAVSEAELLPEALDAARIVYIEQDAMAHIDRAWIRQAYERGTYVVGLNARASALGDLLGVESSIDDLDMKPEHILITIANRTEGPDGGNVGMSTGYFKDMEHVVALTLGEVHEQDAQADFSKRSRAPQVREASAPSATASAFADGFSGSSWMTSGFESGAYLDYANGVTTRGAAPYRIDLLVIGSTTCGGYQHTVQSKYFYNYYTSSIPGRVWAGSTNDCPDSAHWGNQAHSYHYGAVVSGAPLKFYGETFAATTH